MTASLGGDGEKGQFIRALDVWLLGPFIIWSGLQENRLPWWARASLIVTGGATVAYNARNWLVTREAEKQREGQELKAEVEKLERQEGISGDRRTRSTDVGDLRAARSRMSARFDRRT